MGLAARTRTVRTLAFAIATLAATLFTTGCGSDSGTVHVATTSGTQAYDFGKAALGTAVRRIAVAVSHDGKGSLSIAPKISGSTDFTIANDVSCPATLSGRGACSIVVLFSPTSATAENATLDLGLSSNSQTISITGTGVQLTPGQTLVAPTDNPQVALLTYVPQSAGDFSVQFGTDTGYGTSTSAQAATAATPSTVYVAGMLAGTSYHMRAVISGGEAGADQTFTSGHFDPTILPNLTVTSDGTQQPGVELMNPVVSKSNSLTYLQAYAIDLQGNVIWGYNYPDRTSDIVIQGIKPLPNGDFAVLLGMNSAMKTAGDPGEPILVREIDLAGVPVHQATLNQVNAQLSGVTLMDFHHDVTVLPSGHWLLLANALKSYNNLPGQTGNTDVLGDFVIDLDPNFKVAWTWSEFDNLDINRAPDNYPDWTHSNAILYSPTDGNLLVSSRHQDWVMKIDYRNGAGTGKILWRLGNEGDFTLVGGTAPQDWFFGQHQPSFLTSNTAGKFEIAMMDNGFNRQLASGTCSGTSCYTTIPSFQVDEAAKTATLIWRDTLDSSLFSIWGGGTTALANRNLEFDLAALGDNSEADEVTLTNPPRVVWSVKATGQNLYRANRIPSLYPGAQW